MAVTIDYNSYEINIPKADTVFVEFDAITGREKRRLDINVFGQALGAVQDDQPDIWASTAYIYTRPINVGGISLAAVLAIQSPYKVTFEAGDWAVFLINGNTNIQDVATVNGVSVYPSNSGGLVGADEISNQSYLDGRVFINTVLGTTDGIGTPTDPVNDFPEAYAIATSRSLNGYKISGNISLDNTDVLVNGNFSGESSDKGNLTFTNVDVNNCVFEDLSLDGTISSGRATYKECELGRTSLTGFDGIAKDCSLPSNLTLSSSGTKPMMFRKCFSAVAGSGKPVVDCNGVTQGINFREQDGGLQISNFNGGGDMSIDAGGVLRLLIDSSCTAGTIVVGGTVLIDDQSGVGCTVIRTSAVQDIIYRNINLA